MAAYRNPDYLAEEEAYFDHQKKKRRRKTEDDEDVDDSYNPPDIIPSKEKKEVKEKKKPKKREFTKETRTAVSPPSEKKEKKVKKEKKKKEPSVVSGDGGTGNSFRHCAFTILKREGVPLTATEIVKKGIKEGMISTSGKTPQNTLASVIYSEIKKDPTSQFVKVAPMTFGLKEFGLDIPPEPVIAAPEVEADGKPKIKLKKTIPGKKKKRKKMKKKK